MCAAEGLAGDAYAADLEEADKWHFQVYKVAAERIGMLIQDKSHYMHDKLAHVEPAIKLKDKAPKGRLEIMQQLAQRKQAEGAEGCLLYTSPSPRDA